MNTLLFFLDFVNHSVFNITYKLVVAVGESARASEGENRVTGNSRWQSGAGSPGAQSHWTGGEGADAGQEVGGVPSHCHPTAIQLERLAARLEHILTERRRLQKSLGLTFDE